MWQPFEFLISTTSFLKVLSVYTMCLKKRKENIIAKEFEKYKKILEREDKEFKEAMKADVSTSLPSNLNKQNERYNSGKTCVITHLTLKFAQFSFD